MCYGVSILNLQQKAFNDLLMMVNCAPVLQNLVVGSNFEK
jgi:hypothetical protein